MRKIQCTDTGQPLCKPKSGKCVYKTIFSICVVYKGKRPGKTIQFLFKTNRFGNKTVKIEVENDHLRRKFDEKSGQKQGRISSKKRWQKCVGFDRFLKKSDNKIRKRQSNLVIQSPFLFRVAKTKGLLCVWI